MSSHLNDGTGSGTKIPDVFESDSVDSGQQAALPSPPEEAADINQPPRVLCTAQGASVRTAAAGMMVEPIKFKNFCNSAAGALATYITSRCLIGNVCATRKAPG